jgi:hypothetical protein
MTDSLESRAEMALTEAREAVTSGNTRVVADALERLFQLTGTSTQRARFPQVLP